MVARRRKRGARGSEQGIPSPPGYSAIPIKFSEKQQASHYLYVREHRVREGTKSSWPQKRTLFVLNVFPPPQPPAPASGLARLLSPCGPVQSVERQEKPDLADRSEEPKSKFFQPAPIRGFQVAYVVFQKPGGVSAALALKGPLLVSTDSHPVKSGIHKEGGSQAPAHHGVCSLQEEAKAKEEEGIPDEEGWVKVTRRVPLLPDLVPSLTAAAGRVWERYLAQLRKKFEEDKQRIELMRAQRKFRPY
uniref:Ribosomal RNA-processing protein 7 homolog A n=1 Tax=Panthera tigris altaica TaxID=74533 RepID=A0A8C9KZ42_PANTA